MWNKSGTSLYKIAALIVLSGFSGVAYAVEDAQAKLDLGTVQTWRASTPAITGRCNLLDADGIQRREVNLIEWIGVQHALVNKVDTNVQAIIPPLINGKEIYLNLITPFRESIYVEIIRAHFLNKSEKEVKTFCQAYSPDSSADTIRQVNAALDRLETWRKENRVSLPEP
jgi:hypothetical protein